MFVHIGFDSSISIDRIIAVTRYRGMPVKRYARDAASKGKLLNLTQNKGADSVIFLDTGHVILSALNPVTIISRSNNPLERK